VAQSGYALQYADESLKSDREILLLAGDDSSSDAPRVCEYYKYTTNDDGDGSNGSAAAGR